MKRLITGKSLLSVILILAGCVCVAIPFILEAREYPWVPSNETDLPDPSPPDFEVIPYDDYIETGQPAQPEPSVTDMLLPGYDDIYDDGAEPSPDVARDSAGTEPVQIPELPKFVLLGTVKIPRINISENLFEGTDRQLRYGVGHLEGTPMPGGEGNSVISAHRVSQSGKHPFRHLDKMQNGDTVIIQMGGETLRYEVFDSFIVNEADLWVLLSIPDETHALTLVTCDPVISVTRRENRLIVRARLVE